jgi:hypothetical protein
MATTALQLSATPGQTKTFTAKAESITYLLDVALTMALVTTLTLSEAVVSAVTLSEAVVSNVSTSEATRT